MNGKTNNIETKKRKKKRTHGHKKEGEWRMVNKRKDEEIRQSLWMVRVWSRHLEEKETPR